MIVGGIPVKTTTHARPVASFALDMIHEANEVKSPATGKPLQVINSVVHIYIYNIYSDTAATRSCTI